MLNSVTLLGKILNRPQDSNCIFIQLLIAPDLVSPDIYFKGRIAEKLTQLCQEGDIVLVTGELDLTEDGWCIVGTTFQKL